MRTMKKKNKTAWLTNTLHKLPLLLVTGAVLYGGFLLRDFELPEIVPVEDIQVIGELHFLHREAIEATVRESISGDYFTLDLNGLRQMLLQQPWVENVSIRRKWPAGLSVFIDEQVPVAFWNNDAYISDSGYIFRPAQIDRTLNLPALNGPAGQHKNVWKFMNVLYRQTILADYEVVRLELDERRAWSMVILANAGVAGASEGKTIDVRLGRFDTEKRLQRFISLLPVLNSKKEFVENRIKTIDMRYPNGFAVHRAEKNETAAVKENISGGCSAAHDVVCRYTVMTMSEA